MTQQPTLLPGQFGLDSAAQETEAADYSKRLRQKLGDPSFRAISGFPLGTDDCIVDISDPPYFTACPNPFVAGIVERWMQQRTIIRSRLGLATGAGYTDAASASGYQRQPFASDVSEGKTDAIYTGHSYHTKVPHKAIMRYILHYTDPGDVIYDGFCGTGMAGVAAQLCDSRRAVEELGYRVDANGVVYEGGQAVSRLGTRKAVLIDLSPTATHIAYNYNIPVDVTSFEQQTDRIMAEMGQKYGWMFESWHPNCDAKQRTKVRVNYTVWSEVFNCSNCGQEIVFLEEALDQDSGKVAAEFTCPSCGMVGTKRTTDRRFESYHDALTQSARRRITLRPILYNYTTGGKTYDKPLDREDLEQMERIESLIYPHSIPVLRMPTDRMYHGSRLVPKGFQYVHDLYLKRQAMAWGVMWKLAADISDRRVRSAVRFMIDQAFFTGSVLNAYRPTGYSQNSQYMKGVYYVPAQVSEVSPWYLFGGKQRRLAHIFGTLISKRGNVVIATNSATEAGIPSESIDYIFTDPPFGENIFYADLNMVPESWYGVRTNTDAEAIIDKPKSKGLGQYQALMRAVFGECYRILKSGRWITVEFHNSHNAVWNAIQEALISAGFVVADVRTLDKQQGSYRQVTASNAAKQDLVISAYKPRNTFEERFLGTAGTPEAVWDFVRQHLAQLPVVVNREKAIEAIAEREPYLLFDRMVAYHVQHGVPVPISTADFYSGLRQRLVERDGMMFLPDQAPEYDRARLQAQRVEQLAFFVTDEKTAIRWLRTQLDPATGGHPQTTQDIQPHFLRQLHQAQHEVMPDLAVMLGENFLQDEQERWYVPNPNKAGDLEKLRIRALLREFAQYAEGRGKLKAFRTEAVRAGFSDAWKRRDYAAITKVAQRLPEAVLHEDPELLMYYDNASLRS